MRPIRAAARHCSSPSPPALIRTGSTGGNRIRWPRCSPPAQQRRESKCRPATTRSMSCWAQPKSKLLHCEPAMNGTHIAIALPSAVLLTFAMTASGQQHRTYPARDPHTPGYVKAKELPDGQLPPPNKDGNFIIGPTHEPASELQVHDDVPHGTVTELTMTSAESKFYPGIAR